MGYSLQKEERLNALSHAIGIPLGITGIPLLLQNDHGLSENSSIAIWIYSLSIILLFAASTWYHAVAQGKLKTRLRILDHISIYALIAGTYTPVTLITLQNSNGWPIFYAVWSLALIGTILKLFFTGRFEIISLLLYLFMGWLIIFDFQNLLDQIPGRGMQLLMLGGLFYTGGIIFYVARKIPYNHLIWHFCVLGGAISHWFLIYDHVI